MPNERNLFFNKLHQNFEVPNVATPSYVSDLESKFLDFYSILSENIAIVDYYAEKLNIDGGSFLAFIYKLCAAINKTLEAHAVNNYLLNDNKSINLPSGFLWHCALNYPDDLQAYRFRIFNQEHIPQSILQNDIRTEKKELFHVPFDQLDKISRCRFSLESMPALYLNESFYNAAREVLYKDKFIKDYETYVDESKQITKRRFYESWSEDFIRYSKFTKKPEVNIAVADFSFNFSDYISKGAKYYDDEIVLAYQLLFRPMVYASTFEKYSTNNPVEYIIPSIFSQYIYETFCDEILGVIYNTTKNVSKFFKGRNIMFLARDLKGVSNLHAVFEQTPPSPLSSHDIDSNRNALRKYLLS